MKKILLINLVLVIGIKLLHAQPINTSSFASSLNLTTVNLNPGRIDAADIDNDGRIDIVVPNSGSNSFSVFLNVSSPGSLTSSSFATRQDFSTGTGHNAQCAKIGDFDGDGLNDIVIGLSTSSILVYRNTTTTSGISFASAVSFTAGSVIGVITLNDFDGDGKLDIATGNYSGNTATILRNTSTGSGSISFSSTVTTLSGATSGAIAGITSGDLDGDGKPEIAISNYWSSSVFIFQNTSSSGSISFTKSNTLSTGSYPAGVIFSDIDGDTKPEVICSNYYGDNISVFRNTSVVATFSFNSGITYTTGSSYNPSDVTASDFNGDLKTDIVASNSTANKITVFQDTASLGTISSSSLKTGINFSSGTGPLNIIAKDLDLDGRVDIITSNNNGTSISIFQNQILANKPSTAASVMAFSNVQNTSMTVKFTKGNGAGRIVLCKASSSVNSTPVSGTLYSANTVLGNGTQLGTGNYVVYSDTGNSFSLSGLSPNTTYYFSVYEYNGINGFVNFLTSSYLSNSQSTLNTTYYYSKSTGYLDSLSTWGTNTDGSGTSPSSFSSGNSYFYVMNNYTPTISSNLSISGTNTVLVVGDGVNTYNLSIPSSLSITTDSFLLKSNSTLTLYGNMSGSKNTFEDTTTVQFLSSSSQNIPAGNYYNILVTSSTKKLNNGNISVSNSLAVMSSIDLNSDTLTLGTSVSQTGTLYYSSGTFFGGTFKRWFSASANSGSSGLFPIGTSSNYRPVQINYTTAPTTGGTLSAAFNSNTPSNSGLPLYDYTTSPFVQINKAGKNGRWVLTASSLSGGQFTASITADGFYGVSSYGDLRMLRRASSTNAWGLTGTAQVTTGSNSTPVLSRTGMNAFGEFGVGADSSTNSLPIKLIILTVHQMKEDAILNWQTASEINSDYFEVQRAVFCSPCTEQSWEALGKVKAAGNSTDIRNYQFIDKLSAINPQPSTIYYRLKQLDKDGENTNSNIISLDIKAKQNSITLFPLPINNILSAVSNNAENINQLIIFDMSGKEVIKSEGNQIDVSMLAQGMYIVKVITDQQTYIQKITK